MDLLLGTSGHDTLDVSTAPVAYEIRGLAGFDVIRGSAYADLIVGGPGYDQMFGNGGDDIFLIVGTDPNSDKIEGGTGVDTILGGPGNDVFSLSIITSVERIDGGGGTDILRGTDNNNYWSFSETTLTGIIEIDGRGGNDQITGSGANDRIIGGAGNDILDGGLGTDTGVYTGDFAGYTITPLASGQLQVFTSANSDGTDKIRGFEILEFANGTFSISSGVFTPFGDPTDTTPVAAADLYAATEDRALVVNAVSGVLANDHDPDGDALTVGSFDAMSVQGGAVAMNPDGSFTYTPASNFNGSDSFSYTAADSHGGVATATVTVNVAAVNDAPVASNNTYTGTQNTALIVNVSSGVLANDHDPDGDALTVGSFDAASAQGGTVAMNADGSFTYTPPASFTGADSFSYTASDGTSQNAATVNLTITAASGLTLLVGTSGHNSLDVSTAPVAYEIRGLAGNDVIRGSAFGDLIVGGPGGDQMFGNGGDDIFLIVGTDPLSDKVDGGAGVDTILGGPGNDVFFLSTITLVERIDGGGGTDIVRGTDANNSWSFSETTLTGNIEIDGRAGNDQITASGGNDRVIGGAGNDILDGGPGVDTAVYTGNFAGYITPLANGQLQVFSSANSDGTDKIRGFEILEFANGTFSISSGVFTPFGNPANTTPVAAADLYAVTEDRALVVNAASGVLANDHDANGDALKVGSFDAMSVQGGAVAMNLDGSFTYTPASNFNGPDSFSYTASDSRGGGGATATVTVNVAAVNDAPVASNNTYYTGTQNTALVVNVSSGVLANDHDRDGDALTVGSFDAASAQGGTVAMSADGSFTYTPPAGFTGADSFSYTASDGTNQDGATAAIVVSLPRPAASAFESIIASTPENEWVRLNVNEFQDVWTPVDQRPNHGSPLSIIKAWGAATWDAHRSEYIFWGGGHANYAGNEVYTWSADTLEWERASLPSKIVQIADAHWETIDGYQNSPIASHAYDNLEFLPVADRMIDFGGAAAHTGGGFVETDGTTRTGPYFWDPSKADPDKVGGLTGSQVNPTLFPDVLGGEMWENRETWGLAAPQSSMVNGTTDYALIDGVDTVFVNPSNQKLYKYSVPDVNDASQDTWELVGTIWDTYSGTGAGAYDADRNIYVRTSQTEFTYWDLNSAGPSNRNVSFMPSDASGEFTLSKGWGMEYDPARHQFVLWEGDATIWYLRPPEDLSAAGWTLLQAPTPTLAAPTPPDGVFNGVLGKWDYLDNYDIFLGVTDDITGDVWAYKPDGWML